MHTVRWSPVFSQSTDFLMPGEGCGEQSFNTKAEARDFTKKLRRNGIVVRSIVPIFGSELKIQTHNKGK